MDEKFVFKVDSGCSSCMSMSVVKVTKVPDRTYEELDKSERKRRMTHVKPLKVVNEPKPTESDGEEEPTIQEDAKQLSYEHVNYFDNRYLKKYSRLTDLRSGLKDGTIILTE